jgi:hypothetical protein
MGQLTVLGIACISICCCSCSTAAHQLFTMGLFPCAPVAPSLAVDLRVLQFVKTLFVRQTPNVTAWCKAVEVFLAGRGYTFAGKVCFILCGIMKA